jgi:acyl homoserine lactone synthase
MIHLVFGQNRAKYLKLIDKMHRLRKVVFYDQLKWDVNVVRNWEIDHYDAVNPLYLIVTNEGDDVIGSVRILPTTGLNMLNDTFPQLLPDGMPIESPRIWELSRFTIRNPASSADFAKISAATAELGLALNEIGKLAGISHYVAVYDAYMHRLLQRTGCAGDPISEPQIIGGVLSFAVTYEVGDEWEAVIHQRRGIGPVTIDQEFVKEFKCSLAA